MNRLKRTFIGAIYHILYTLTAAISLLPYRALYLFADFLALTLHSVVRYRRRVVRENLTSSFPEKSLDQIKDIEKGFYRFLCDYFVETLKLATMTEKQMRRRLTVENIEEVNASVRRGSSVSLFLGHYCNWEWVSSLPLHIDAKAVCGQIYHPLESQVSDRLFLRLRGRFGALSIPMDDSLRRIAGWYRKGTPFVVGYIADQVPGYGSIHYWADFLHHDTPVFTGAERISRMVHADCYYLHLTRPCRGYYHLRFVRLAADAAAAPKFSVTQGYFSALERQIEEHPQYWLWSHRRWKRTREEFNRIYGDEAADRLTRL